MTIMIIVIVIIIIIIIMLVETCVRYCHKVLTKNWTKHTYTNIIFC